MLDMVSFQQMLCEIFLTNYPLVDVLACCFSLVDETMQVDHCPAHQHPAATNWVS